MQHCWWAVQFRCSIQDAQGWCTGMTQRDDMGREVGGGFRMGNTCTPVVDSCWCMAKPIQYCKVKKKIKSLMSCRCVHKAAKTWLFFLSFFLWLLPWAAATLESESCVGRWSQLCFLDSFFFFFSVFLSLPHPPNCLIQKTGRRSGFVVPPFPLHRIFSWRS